MRDRTRIPHDNRYLRYPQVRRKGSRPLASQAKAIAEVPREVFADALQSTLASHADMERIERKLIEHDGEFKLIKFMITMLLGGVVALILKSFFF